ncbi:adenylate/guanylate cyclase domain-containing protein [Steroidobacter flavus]|uniref:Adenylate/guanylate cyclase domain-containing protein n=1 Tax=Steroidobacter flavus TaxID=1842136 RepID=A0ABV8SNB5_9GAMM
MANTEYFTKAYRDAQITRTLATLEKIRGRSSVPAGRVIPDADDLPIHAGRRLDATVLFLDISKFSQRPAWTEGEQDTLLRILSLFFTEMIRIIEDFGGVVEKNTGDGLMAYFVAEPGDTISVQQRALAAALTMFYAADNYINPILRSSQLEPLQFRICMDHGPITVAKVGSARGFNGIVAIGTTANIASKMLAAADPNTILMGTKALVGLPTSWQTTWARPKTSETGWFYRGDSSPYTFWTYVGRWLEPTT